MTVIFAGQHDVIHFGTRTNPVRDKYWAERGMIHIEDTETGAYDTIPVREFLERLQAVNDMLGNSRSTMAAEGFAHSDEIRRQQDFVQKGEMLARKAKEQGMPSEASARAEARRRRPKSVVVPSAIHSF